MENCAYYEELISASLDGELTPAEEAALHAHLASCEDCRRYYRALSALSGAVERELPAPPAALTENIMAQVRAASPAPEKKKIVRLRAPMRAAALAAAAALVLWAGWRAAGLFGPKGAAAPQMAASESADNTGAAPAAAAGIREDAAEAPEPAPEAGEAYNGERAEAEEPCALMAVPAEAEELFYLYRGDTDGELLFSGPDDSALRELLTPDKPAAAPDRAPDYTAVLALAGGGEELWYLWEEDGVILCRRDGGDEAGSSVSAALFRERLGLED